MKPYVVLRTRSRSLAIQKPRSSHSNKQLTKMLNGFPDAPPIGARAQHRDPPRHRSDARRGLAPLRQVVGPGAGAAAI